MTIAVPVPPPTARRPWLRAALWLAGLGVLFYTSYPLANYLADRRAFVPSIVFGWERGMPFLPWTIIPYWSINFFYAASLFFCRSRAEVDTLGRRLLTAQLVAVTCFILVPLRFSFAKPEIGGGLPGFMFDALLSFDKPYNQAPSLHIALLVILWAHYSRYVPAWMRWSLHIWFVLIGVSVLTTYQHHFFDIPTGALLGLFCLWLWPDARSAEERPACASFSQEGSTSCLFPRQRGEAKPVGGATCPTGNPQMHVSSILPDKHKRRRLACYFGLGAVIFLALALFVGGWGLWLCYPAISLALVAANYLWRGAAGFHKRLDGSMPVADRLLFAPYQLGAFVNSRWWTRRAQEPVQILPGLFLGRIPSRLDRNSSTFGGIIDLCAELPASRGNVQAFPLLDLVAPEPMVLTGATKAVEAAREHGTVLVCCALGYSRSAAVVATWLLRSGRARTVDEAVGIMRAARPGIVLGPGALTAIAAAGKAGQVDG